MTTNTPRATQLVKILRHFQSGKDLTVVEARTRFGVRSLSKRVHELRTLGFQVFTNRKTVRNGNNKGERVTTYLLDPRN